jgi:hypothetical protein
VPRVTNVVPFAPKSAEPDNRAVWRCVCGCLTHFVRADQEIECASCGNIAAEAGEWRRRPEAPTVAAEVDQTDVVVKDLGDAGTAIRKILRNLAPSEMVCLVVVRDDGTISTWNGRTETEEQKEWLRLRLAAASGMMGL